MQSPLIEKETGSGPLLAGCVSENTLPSAGQKIYSGSLLFTVSSCTFLFFPPKPDVLVTVFILIFLKVSYLLLVTVLLLIVLSS